MRYSTTTGDMVRSATRGASVVLALVLIFTVAVQLVAAQPDANGAPVATACPDLSGLAWTHGGTFLAVHDAKNPSERSAPRVSLVRLPAGGRMGVRCTALDVRWPGPQGLSHDLESIARIPGTRSYLFLESGDDGSVFQRIFLARLEGADTGKAMLVIQEVAAWPVRATNVEGTAVAKVDGQHVFLFAERADGAASTQIVWAPLQLRPLAFGRLERVTFRSPDPTGPHARPVSALEVGPHGRLFVSSALDPDIDIGPFRSVVWEIGRLDAGTQSDSLPTLTTYPQPRRIATLDGLKVEGLAWRQASPEGPELFASTDDEHYGSALRPLPLRRENRAGTAGAPDPRAPRPNLERGQ